jgi:hypothetical protein
VTKSSIRTPWTTVWPALRNVASWAVGVYWGSAHVVGAPGSTDWGDVFLVAACMSLPLAYRADELLKARIKAAAETGEPPSTNGSDEAVSRAS